MATYFFPDTIRGIIKALIYQFSDIHVKNFLDGEKVITDLDPRAHKPWAKDIQIPIKFGPRDKIYDLRTEDRYGDGQKYYIMLPTSALELTNVTYDPNRQTNINQIRHFYSENADLAVLDKYFEDQMPLAFNFDFNLSYRVDSISHYTQVIEQILPMFRSNMVIAVKEFSFINLERDLNIELVGVTNNFSNEIAEDGVRTIEFTFGIRVKGFIYSPITYSEIVKEIRTSVYFIKPDETIDLSGEGWLSRPIPKAVNDEGLTPWEYLSGEIQGAQTFIPYNAGAGNQFDNQITQLHTYYGYGPKVNFVEQETSVNFLIHFDQYVDDTFSVSNFVISDIPGQTTPNAVVLTEDPGSTLRVTINNAASLADQSVFILTYSGLTRGGYPGAPRRLEIVYTSVV